MPELSRTFVIDFKKVIATIMDKIFNLGSVDQYHKLYGFETLNPLVSAIDLNEATRQDTTGTHSGESDRNDKGTYGRYRGYRQPDCLFAGISVPAAFLPSVQKTGGMYT